MSPVSRYPAALQRCQLRFSRMLLVHGFISQAHRSQAGRHVLCQHFSRHLLLLSNFLLLTRLPFWLLTSPPHSEQEGEAKLILLGLLYLTDMSREQYPSLIFRVQRGKPSNVAHLSLYFITPCPLQSN